MKFSVIIPAYNVSEYLEKCVASVLAQSYTDYEAILVDDGSTDGKTGVLCDRLCAAHPDRLRVIHQTNGGLGAARNTGIEHAAGEYLAFLDSDDFIAPDMLQQLHERIAATHSEIYTFGFAVEKNGQVEETCFDDLPQGRTFCLADTPRLLLSTPNAWNRVYRRELFERTGIRYPGRVWFEDIRTTMKLFAAATSVETVHEAFYYYVVREDSITHSANVERNREILEAFDDLIAYYREEGLFERYEQELCRLAIDHIYLAASVRVLRMDRKSPLLAEFAEYMQRNFPNYHTNPYLSELSKARALAFSLLEKRKYGALALLFRIKGS